MRGYANWWAVSCALARLRAGAVKGAAFRRMTAKFIRHAFALLAIPGLALAGSSGNLLYQFDFVARTGDAGVSTIPGATLGAIGQSPSINAFGAIGFQAGLSTGGNGLFVAKIGASVPTNINPFFSNSPSRVFSGAVQINSSNLIAARDQISGAPPQNLIRFWDADATDTFTTLARGGGGTDPFDSVFAFPSGNDNGDIVFSALDAGLGVLATPVTKGDTSNFNKIQLTGPLLPKIALGGKIALRAGNTAASPIRLYDNSLASFVSIAGGGAAGFSTVGRAPSLNTDGTIVVFAGNRGNGDGVFASIDTGAGPRKVIKIAGEGTVGVTPLTVTGAPVIPPDLGYDDSLAPIGFASIAVDSRVGLAHQTLGVLGLDGDSFVVSFIATPQVATQTDFYLPGVAFTPNRGIWTVRVDIFNKSGELRFRLGPPMPVVQIGDLVQSSGLTPQSFTIDALPDLYDPIANVQSDDGITPRPILPGEHYLVFAATSGATQLLVRAKQVDTCLTRVIRLPQGGTNAPWAAEKYAFSTTKTIAAKGCAMTSFAMQTNSLFLENTVARSFDPLAMNVFTKSAQAYVGGGNPTNLVAPLAVAALNPLSEVATRGLSIVYAEEPGASWKLDASRKGILDPALLPGALGTIDAAVCNERAPIRIGVEISCSKVGPGVNDIDGNPKCVPKTEYIQVPLSGKILVEVIDPVTGLVVPKTVGPGHFILVAGKVGSNYFLADPGHKTRKLLGAAPYNNVFELRGIVVDPPDRSFMTAVVNANADLFLTDTLSRSTGVDPATGLIRNEIPGSSYSHEKYDSQDTLQDADEQFSTLYILNPAAGTYSLTVLETANGPYEIQIDIARPDGGLQTPIAIGGVATPGITKIYQLNLATSVGGPPPSVTLQFVVVPDLFGFTQSNGSAFLVTAGLAVGSVTSQASSTVPAGQIISQIPAAGTQVAPGTAVNIVVSTGAGSVTVPNVVGQTQAAANTAITSAGLVVGTVTMQVSTTVPAGSVISQNPAAGASVAAGSVVELVVSTGPASVTVPNVVGQTQAAATTAITNAGLVVGTLTTQLSATVPAGNVISQSPAAGASVASGSAVALVISSGPGGFAAGTTFVASASNAAPTAITSLAVQCPSTGLLVVTGSGESAAKSNFAGNAFIGLAYSIARDDTATDNSNVVQSSALAKFNGDANRDFLNVQRVDVCTPGAGHTYTLTAYATTPQTNIANGSFVWNGRLVASGGPASSSFAAGTTFVGSASNASPTILTTLPVLCPASGMLAVTGSGESAARSNFAGNAFMGLAYSISRDSVATDNGNVVQSSALAVFNGDANRDFLNVQRVDSCSPGLTNTYRLTAYATTPHTGIASESFVWNGRLTATALPVVTGAAPGTTFIGSASNAAPTVVTSLSIVCPASGVTVVTGSGESAAQSNFAGNAFIGLAYSIARDSAATDNSNVVQSSALAAFNGDANRDFLNVQRADTCTPGEPHTYFLTAYATTAQTGITNNSFVWNGRLVAILPP